MSSRRPPRDPSSGEFDLFGGPSDLAPPLQRRTESDVPGESPNTAVSIIALNEIVRLVVEGAFIPLWVRGEVSDFKKHRNGHWYFSLRDGDAQIRCVIWKRDRMRVAAAPDDGMQVVVLAQPTVYPARGELHLTIRAMEAEGDGLLLKAFAKARARLERDGLLDPARKRALPPSPRRIAVVTSASGAAIHDVIAVVRRRAPSVEVVVVNAKVQGTGAAEELVAAIRRISRWGEADVVIIGRGGGASDDLWAFNDERVARAIAACPIPTISAVGHEVDVTLCDLVADLRAATPSAAAESAVPDIRQLRRSLRASSVAMRRALTKRVASEQARWHALAASLRFEAGRGLTARRARLRAAGAQLEALSPLATLSRGYSVARDADGRALKRATAFTAGSKFELLFADGTVSASTHDVTLHKEHPSTSASQHHSDV